MALTSGADILIIGGGVIGLALARELRIGGAGKITILEKNSRCGAEASFAAAGMLAPQSETDKFDDFYYFCRDSRDDYPRFAKQLLDETGIDIELDCRGTLYLALTERDSSEIRRRYEWQTKAGLEVELLPAAEACQSEPFISPDAREALFFPKDWQVENRELIRALRKYAELYEIETIENVRVKNLLIENGAIKGAETDSEKFFAETVVLTTGAWTSLIKTGDAARLPDIKPIRGQMFSFRAAKRLFTKVIYSPRGYIVPRADGRILVGATVEDAGFEKVVTDSGIEFLRGVALEIAPSLINLKISDRWAGLRPCAADKLPILGAIAGIENLYVAAAHYRNGILLAPLTAQLLANEILENTKSKYLEIFSPRRFQKAQTL